MVFKRRGGRLCHGEAIGGETSSAAKQAYPPLEHDARTDVAVIGAGITGLSAALHLKNAGARVLVLEAHTVGSGTTGGTSAHLDAVPDQGAAQLLRDVGEAQARLITQTRLDAISQIESWSENYGIDCDFKRVGAFSYAESSEELNSLQSSELPAMQKAGLTVAAETHVPLPFRTVGGLFIEQQGRFHSLDYVYGLARIVHGDKCAVYERTRVMPPADGSPCTIATTDGKRIEAASVVVATHSSFLGISHLDTRMAPYISYVIAVEVDDDVPDALFWDQRDPYNYIRVASSMKPRLLLIGGADHKTAQDDEFARYEALERYVRERFAVRNIASRWSAEYFNPVDNLPFIGRVPFSEHIYIAAAFLGTGLTYGTAGATIIAQLIQGQSPPTAEIFSPARVKPLAAAKSFALENFNALKTFVGDRIEVPTINSPEELHPGEGRVVSLNGKVRAAYRDQTGEMHFLSPVCTHAGCYVRWNSAENLWDCPCHGGRYLPTGERFYGPPPRDLPKKPL